MELTNKTATLIIEKTKPRLQAALDVAKKLGTEVNMMASKSPVLSAALDRTKVFGTDILRITSSHYESTQTPEINSAHIRRRGRVTNMGLLIAASAVALFMVCPPQSQVGRRAEQAQNQLVCIQSPANDVLSSFQEEAAIKLDLSSSVGIREATDAASEEVYRSWSDGNELSKQLISRMNGPGNLDERLVAADVLGRALSSDDISSSSTDAILAGFKVALMDNELRGPVSEKLKNVRIRAFGNYDENEHLVLEIDEISLDNLESIIGIPNESHIHLLEMVCERLRAESNESYSSDSEEHENRSRRTNVLLTSLESDELRATAFRTLELISHSTNQDLVAEVENGVIDYLSEADLDSSHADLVDFASRLVRDKDNVRAIDVLGKALAVNGLSEIAARTLNEVGGTSNDPIEITWSAIAVSIEHLERVSVLNNSGAHRDLIEIVCRVAREEIDEYGSSIYDFFLPRALNILGRALRDDSLRAMVTPTLVQTSRSRNREIARITITIVQDYILAEANLDESHDDLIGIVHRELCINLHMMHDSGEGVVDPNDVWLQTLRENQRNIGARRGAELNCLESGEADMIDTQESG